MKLTQQHWYGVWKRGDSCRVCGRSGNWRLTHDDGTVEVLCDQHAPEEGRVYTDRCQEPGCTQVYGWLDPDGVWRCDTHHKTDLPVTEGMNALQYETLTRNLMGDTPAKRLDTDA